MCLLAPARFTAALVCREASRNITNNYGDASAVNFFGRRCGLPTAFSNHQNYWLWGARGATGEIVIALGSDGSVTWMRFDKMVT